jgi:hypothetical protein
MKPEQAIIVLFHDHDDDDIWWWLINVWIGATTTK